MNQIRDFSGSFLLGEITPQSERASSGICKGDDQYEIVECEFYLFNEEHPDVITYPRKIDAGQWFFHQSGVDLTFESDEKQYGGILIRGIRRIKDKKLILGPLKCVYELWDKFNAFKPSVREMPVLTDGKTSAGIDEFVRWITFDTKKTDRQQKINGWIKANGKNQIIDEYKANRIVFEKPYRFVKNEIVKIVEEASGYKAKLHKVCQFK